MLAVWGPSASPRFRQTRPVTWDAITTESIQCIAEPGGTPAATPTRSGQKTRQCVNPTLSDSPFPDSFHIQPESECFSFISPGAAASAAAPGSLSSPTDNAIFAMTASNTNGSADSPPLIDPDIEVLIGTTPHPEVSSLYGQHRHPDYHHKSGIDNLLSSPMDYSSDEACDCMDALEQLFRPNTSFSGLLSDPKPSRGFQQYPDDGTNSESDDAAATALSLPIPGATDGTMLSDIQGASKCGNDSGAASGGESDTELIRRSNMFDNVHSKKAVLSIAPVAKQSATKSTMYTAATDATARRICKSSQQAINSRGSIRALKLDPADPCFHLDRYLFDVFTDDDLRLGKSEWAVRLKSADLDAEHVTRVKKLRRTILSRGYAGKNRNKNKQQNKITSEQRSHLLAENAELRSENKTLKAELQQARLQIAAMRR